MRRLPIALSAVTLFALLGACGVDSSLPDNGERTFSPLWLGNVTPIDPKNPPPLDPKTPKAYDGVFIIKPLGKRCVDLGYGFGRVVKPVAGAQVTLRDCDAKAESQQIRVTELAHHDIQLRPISDAALCVGVRGGVVDVKAPNALELQPCDSRSEAQRFAFDGDTLMIGGAHGRVDRHIAIQPLGARTREGTPLVIAERNLSEAQYLRFYAPDGTERRAHSGFVVVTSEAQLDAALKLGWGTVIEIDSTKPLIVRRGGKQIGTGHTIRGYQKALTYGSTIELNPIHDGGEGDDAPWRRQSLFEIGANIENARVTGLHLIGPVHGASYNGADDQEHNAVMVFGTKDIRIDHNDMWRWSSAGVIVDRPGWGQGSGDAEAADQRQTCAQGIEPRERTPAAEIVGNFLHENYKERMGYGAAVYRGRFASIRGNTFYKNRHSIAAQGLADTGYIATDNFVLSDWSRVSNTAGPDFDIHGGACNHHVRETDPTTCHWNEGIGGDTVILMYNTFLRTERAGFIARGYPCEEHTIKFNSFRMPRGTMSQTEREITSPDPVTGVLTDNIVWLPELGTANGSAINHLYPGPGVFTEPNEYSQADATDDLAVGDFDGDGIDDLFVGTGTGFFYSSGGKTEWRFLNRSDEHSSRLRFGDFDGDGRTDVLRVSTFNGRRAIDISWAGISPWDQVTYIDVPLEDIGVGDFNGDRYADIFMSDGSKWQIANGAGWFRKSIRQWDFFRTSGFRAIDLKFADIVGANNGPIPDGKTDVLRLGVSWQVVSAEPFGSTWWPLPSSPSTDPGDDLVLGDFDNDGVVDIVRTRRSSTTTWLGTTHVTTWEISKRGRTPFQHLRQETNNVSPRRNAAPGHFDPTRSSDLALWNYNNLDLDLSPGASGSPILWSRAHLK